MKQGHPGWGLMYLFTLLRLLEEIIFFVALCLKSIEISSVGMIAVAETMDIKSLSTSVIYS